MTASRRIRLLCVDDHPLVREGITALVARQPDMEVAAVAANGQQAVELFRAHRPDIVLMDLQLPVMNGLDAIRAIREFDSTARIIVLTMYQGDEDIFRALQAGAVTYLLKDTVTDDLVGIVREVYAGRRPMPPNVQKQLDERATQPALTPREVEVVRLVARGMQNSEIAAELGVSRETIKVHIKNILAKLHVSDRTSIVTVALERGILHLNPRPSAD